MPALEHFIKVERANGTWVINDIDKSNKYISSEYERVLEKLNTLEMVSVDGDTVSLKEISLLKMTSLLRMPELCPIISIGSVRLLT